MVWDYPIKSGGRGGGGGGERSALEQMMLLQLEKLCWLMCERTCSGEVLLNCTQSVNDICVQELSCAFTSSSSVSSCPIRSHYGSVLLPPGSSSKQSARVLLKKGVQFLLLLL